MTRIAVKLSEAFLPMIDCDEENSPDVKSTLTRELIQVSFEEPIVRMSKLPQ